MSALSLGQSVLSAAQAAIQTTGNNIANAATPGYSRQTVSFSPTRDGRAGGYFLGRGVEVGAVRRQVDDALQARLWTSLSSENAASSDLSQLASLEATLNALGDTNVSSRLGDFFDAWSDLANSPNQAGAAAQVVQEGQGVASYLQAVRGDLLTQRAQIDRDLRSLATRANDLSGQVARLNQDIVVAEAGAGVANGLRDQRDTLVTELAALLDVTAVPRENGTVDLLVGSQPLVLGGTSRGIAFRQETVGDDTQVSLVTLGSEPDTLAVRSGRLGSLLAQRDTLVTGTIERLDSLAAALVFEVNRIHSTGYAAQPAASHTGTLAVPAADRALALNDPANATFAGLPFRASSGAFTVTVRNNATGLSQSVRVQVDLDGRTATLAPGFADDTSLDDLRAALGAVPNLGATLDGAGRLTVAATPGYSVSFDDDTSGVLAVLGVNSYFQGDSAADIAVRPALLASSGLLSTGRVEGGVRNASGVATAIAALREAPVQGLGGFSMLAYWDTAVQDVAVRTAAAQTAADSASLVRQSLDAQKAAVSGVSTDEEAINLIKYQQQYSAGARFINVVNEMTQTLLQLV